MPCDPAACPERVCVCACKFVCVRASALCVLADIDSTGPRTWTSRCGKPARTAPPLRPASPLPICTYTCMHIHTYNIYICRYTHMHTYMHANTKTCVYRSGPCHMRSHQSLPHPSPSHPHVAGRGAGREHGERTRFEFGASQLLRCSCTRCETIRRAGSGGRRFGREQLGRSAGGEPRLERLVHPEFCDFCGISRRRWRGWGVGTV